jgi:predicted HAD superfamily phosphohydrolase YqeG
MDEEQAAHHLLNVLEERGLNVDLDKILLGFEDADIKHEAAAWVEEYLHEDTLLTKEELELYASSYSRHVQMLTNLQIPKSEKKGVVAPV